MFRCIYVYISIIKFSFFLTKPSNISKALSILYMNKYCMLYLIYKKENYLFLKKKKKRNCNCFINVNWQYSTKRKIYNFMLLNYKIIIILFFWNRDLSIWRQLLTKMYSAIKSCHWKWNRFSQPMVDSPEKVLFVFGFGCTCISISYFKSLLDITSILKVHKQLSAILLLNY